MKINKLTTALYLSVLLSGCATDNKQSSGGLRGEAGGVINGQSTVDGRTHSLNGTQMANVELGTQANVYGEDDLLKVSALMRSAKFSDPSSPLSTRTIYFEYDSSQVLEKFEPIIEAHAEYLMRHPGQNVVLEGHSDERGTREYNISLGEQRANSIFKRLQLLGVQSAQTSVVSYGEEKPIAYEHNAAAFKLNRRVDIVYK